MKKYLLEIILLAISILPYIYLANIYDNLPEQVPTHFGLDGTANGWSHKDSLWAVPASLGIFINLIMLLVPVLDPKKKIQLMGGKYNSLRAIFTVFLSLLAVYLIYISKGGSFKNPAYLFALLGLLFVILGNYLQTVRANYFFGIRTPWTLESETVWKKTHRLGGRLWMAGGLLIMLLCLVLQNNKALGILFTIIIIIMSITCVAYSYIEYLKLKK